MRVKNNFKELREKWYSWTVYIDGTEDELDQIAYVTYLLHESFPQRRIVSTDKEKKFARKATGWGEFLLKTEVILHNGEKKSGELWLNLGFDTTHKEKKEYNGEITKSS